MTWEEFVLDHQGIEKRYNDFSFDWFDHSPDNMICDQNKKQIPCNRLVRVRFDHLNEDLLPELDRILGYQVKRTLKPRNHANRPLKLQTTPEMKAIIYAKCCPLVKQ